MSDRNTSIVVGAHISTFSICIATLGYPRCFFRTHIDMDDYLFSKYVRDCRNVVEQTSYLEILNYSVSLSPPSLSASIYVPFF